MLYVETAISILMLLSIVAVLIGQATGRIVPKTWLHGNVPWIFYLIEKMFADNNSSAKEVKEDEMPEVDQR
jgi:hypothetical protein